MHKNKNSRNKTKFLKRKNKTQKAITPYKRHFRIYLKNRHPAFIVDEEGNIYVFHRVTHSKTSGGKKNWEIKPNPIKGDTKPMHIVKREERDKKARFSLFEIELKDGIDVSYPEIQLMKNKKKNKD